MPNLLVLKDFFVSFNTNLINAAHKLYLSISGLSFERKLNLVLAFLIVLCLGCNYYLYLGWCETQESLLATQEALSASQINTKELMRELNESTELLIRYNEGMVWAHNRMDSLEDLAIKHNKLASTMDQLSIITGEDLVSNLEKMLKDYKRSLWK